LHSRAKVSRPWLRLRPSPSGPGEAEGYRRQSCQAFSHATLVTPLLKALKALMEKPRRASIFAHVVSYVRQIVERPGDIATVLQLPE
jgi:hypothetical protein